jgi:hypothetical protein
LVAQKKNIARGKKRVTLTESEKKSGETYLPFQPLATL